MFLEWRGGEEYFRKAARISCKLPLFAGGVAVAQNYEIDFRRRIAHFLNRNQTRRRRNFRVVDKHVFGIDVGRPDVSPCILRVSLLQDDLDRGIRRRESQRLAEGPHHGRGFIRRLPLAKNGSEAARIKHAFSCLIANLEKVFTEVSIVDRLAYVTGPGEWFDLDSIDTEDFLLRVAGVVI